MGRGQTPQPRRSMQANWSTSNTKLAAALGALLFPVRTQVYQDSRSGKVTTYFHVGDVSVDGNYQRAPLLDAWRKGDLAKEVPLHPLLQGLRAEHNYELLIDAQKQGRRLRLVGVAGSYATEYRDGEEAAELLFAKMRWQTMDLSLVAALGTLGVPVIAIEKQDGRHLYTLPLEGHPLKQMDGTVARYNGLNLGQRSQPGKHELLLESTAPDHPLVAAYNARAVHVQLIKHLHEEGRLIVYRPPGVGLGRMAITTEDPAENVKKKLRDHFR